MDARESVLHFLEKWTIPVSIKKISNELAMKKKLALAICHKEPGVLKVHPSHCGSGKEKASLFILSSDEKWIEIKEFSG